MAVNVYDGTRWLNLGTGHIYTESGWQHLHPQDKLFCSTNSGAALGNGAYHVYTGVANLTISVNVDNPEVGVGYHFQLWIEDPSNLRFFCISVASGEELAAATEWHSMTPWQGKPEDFPEWPADEWLLNLDVPFSDERPFILLVSGPRSDLDSLRLRFAGTRVYP